jgi:hypothetical protein
MRKTKRFKNGFKQIMDDLKPDHNADYWQDGPGIVVVMHSGLFHVTPWGVLCRATIPSK